MRKMVIENWMEDEQIRRKKLFRDLFNGVKLDHIPLDIRVKPPALHSIRDQYQNADKQLDESMNIAMSCWDIGEYTDFIPALTPDVGCSCIATAFGGEYYWGDNVDQTPGIKDKIIFDIEKEIEQLTIPDVNNDGWLKEGLKRIKKFAEAGEGFIPVSSLDAAGGLNVAADLLGVSELLIAVMISPDAVHKLLDKIQITFINLIDESIKAAGGIHNITSTDFFEIWCPEGFKGHCSDDISAMISPEMFKEFSAPYNAMVYEKYGPGGLHNCGPNPCHEAYISHKYPPSFVDLAEEYSIQDLHLFKESFKKKAFIFLKCDFISIDQAEKQYTEIMELMAQDVMVIPTYETTDKQEAKETYLRLMPISKEYAKRMNFGFERI
jgi:hypothetical protein